MSASLAKKPSASGSAVTPSRFGSCPTATVRPTPIRTPVRVAGLMFSTSEPSRNALIASRHTPTRAVSVKASRSRSSALRGDRAASEVATRTAMVDVVETLSARDPPSRAYTAIGAMHV